MYSTSSGKPAWQRQLYHPRRECDPLPLEVVELNEVIGRVVPTDLLAALAGRRGGTFYLRGTQL